MKAEEVAEALTISYLSAKKHLEEKISLKSALYMVSRSRKPGLRALRLARKILYNYSIDSYWANELLEKLGLEGVDEKIILGLILVSIKSGIDLGDPEPLIRALRRSMRKLWPQSIEPWIGLIKSFKHFKEIFPTPPSYQPWFIRLLYRVLGREEAWKLIRFQDENKPRTYVVLNTLLSSAERILEDADKAGVKLVKDGRLPGIYILERAEDTRSLTALIRAGYLLVQDFSSYYTVYVADPKPGQIVLDVCAAPGSKTILMGILMRNRGLIVSIDSSVKRLYTHLRRVRRAGLRIVEDVVADATIQHPLRIQADLAILDPPCSSTGLFWREPMYKQMIKPRHVKMFAKLQAKMLDSIASQVKPGGYIIYSTCSLTLEENELLIEDFLKKHPDYELSEVDPELGSPALRGLEYARRLYPHRDYCNGFFLAKLRRRW